MKNKTFGVYSRGMGRYHYAIKLGKIKRKPCVVCGFYGKNGSGIHGHHEDYVKPYKVIWLCGSHHSRLHSLRRNNHTAKQAIKIMKEEKITNIVKNKEVKPIKGFCPICGSGFVSNYKQKIYCSDKCRLIRDRERSRQNYLRITRKDGVKWLKQKLMVFGCVTI